MPNDKAINNEGAGILSDPQARPHLAHTFESAIRKRAFAAAHSLVRGVQSSRSTSVNRSETHSKDHRKNHQAPRNPRIRAAVPLLGAHQDIGSQQQPELFKHRRAAESNSKLDTNVEKVPRVSSKARPASIKDLKAVEEPLHPRADRRAKISAKDDVKAISAAPVSHLNYIPPDMDRSSYYPHQNINISTSNEQQVDPWKGLEEASPAEYEVSLKRKFRDLVVLINDGLAAVVQNGEFGGQEGQLGDGSGGLDGCHKKEKSSDGSAAASERLVKLVLDKLKGNLGAMLGDQDASAQENVEEQMEEALAAAQEAEERMVDSGGGELWSIDGPSSSPQGLVQAPQMQHRAPDPALSISLPQPLPISNDNYDPTLQSLSMSLSADEGDNQSSPGTAVPLSSIPMLPNYECNEDMTTSSNGGDSLPSDFDLDF